MRGAVLGLEVLHHVASLRELGGAVQADVAIAAEREVILQDVDHLGHLGVTQDAMALRFKSRKHLVQYLRPARRMIMNSSTRESVVGGAVIPASCPSRR